MTVASALQPVPLEMWTSFRLEDSESIVTEGGDAVACGGAAGAAEERGGGGQVQDSGAACGA